jgi:bacillithiol system protein YtxJ|tara:strand:+ start:18099 stop:18488 length:390 start_codon:yes stop_codon:yes gene_type:complete
MGWFSSKEENKKVVIPNVSWKNLSNLKQLDEVLENRSGEKHLLFKHSTRCGVSAMVKKQFENEWPAEQKEIVVWYLDLLNHRDISNAIAEKTGVFHQSPQAIAVINGEVVYDASHSQISARSIIKSFKK